MWFLKNQTILSFMQEKLYGILNWVISTSPQLRFWCWLLQKDSCRIIGINIPERGAPTIINICLVINL